LGTWLLGLDPMAASRERFPPRIVCQASIAALWSVSGSHMSDFMYVPADLRGYRGGSREIPFGRIQSSNSRPRSGSRLSLRLARLNPAARVNRT
jgi:hypothetical protein